MEFGWLGPGVMMELERWSRCSIASLPDIMRAQTSKTCSVSYYSFVLMIEDE